MKLGCHAVLFKDKIGTQTEMVLKQIQDTGFLGTEIGARFFGTDKKEYLMDVLTKHNVEMSGMHVVIVLTDVIDKKESAFNGVMKVVEFVKDMPNKNVIMTGLHKQDPTSENEVDIRLKDEEFVKSIAIGLNELALKAKEMGVRINYHNHSWEFENDALLFNSIGKYAPDLCFALDLGWVFYSGYDPLAIIDKYPNRIHYVHLRDYNKNTKEFGDLGEGSQNYRDIMSKLQEVLQPEDWAIVEYETGEEDYTRYIRAYDFLEQFKNI